MSLTKRDRAKINAALVLLRDEGHDVAEVTNMAALGIRCGTPARMAYDRAFNKLVERVPSIQAPLQRLGQLIDASDHATIAQYNVGLAAYIDTGDRAHLDAIAPIAQRDAAEMARRTGDAGFADGLDDTAPAAAAPTPQAETRPGWGPGGSGYSPSRAAATNPPADPGAITVASGATSGG